MMTSNNALVPDPDKQDDLASKAWQWPILNVGLRMCGWDDSSMTLALFSTFCGNPRALLTRYPDVKYFLLGNPLVYWGSTFSLPLLAAFAAYYLIRWQRGYRDLSPQEIDHFIYSGMYPMIGWFLHYLPFVVMARVTYVHHYYPALYFAIIVAGFCLDWSTTNMRKDKQWLLYGALYLITAGLFWYFRAICFGLVGTANVWSHLRWLKSWKMCDAEGGGLQSALIEGAKGIAGLDGGIWWGWKLPEGAMSTVVETAAGENGTSLAEAMGNVTETLTETVAEAVA